MPLHEENLAMEEHVGMEDASSFSESVITNKSLGFLLFLLLMSSIHTINPLREVCETNFLYEMSTCFFLCGTSTVLPEFVPILFSLFHFTGSHPLALILLQQKKKARAREKMSR
jgi:hypothetical protein